MTHHVKMGRTVSLEVECFAHFLHAHIRARMGGVVWLMAVSPPLDVEILTNTVRRLASSSEEAGEDKGGGWRCGEE